MATEHDSGVEGPQSEGRSDRLHQFLAAPRRALWVMAAPMIAGMTVHTLYVVADTAFIGTLGTDALAAATFVAPLFFLVVALTMGLGTAVTALVAQAVGRGDAASADAAAGTALSSGLVLGVIFGVVGLAIGPWMLGLLGAEGEVAALGWTYFQPLALFMPIFFVSSVLRSILTGEGDAKTPMIVLTVATLSNIALDALFIFGLGLGLRGAALATVLSVVISASAGSSRSDRPARSLRRSSRSRFRSRRAWSSCRSAAFCTIDSSRTSERSRSPRTGRHPRST
jgi:putative MATE family efflux protein